MSLLEGKDTSFLLMEVNGLAHPGFEQVRDFFHGVDHGGKLGVQSIGEESLYFRSVASLGLISEILEFGEICLEAIVLSSGGLFQLVEFVSGRLFEVVGVEHVFEGLFYGLPVFVHSLDF